MKRRNVIFAVLVFACVTAQVFAAAKKEIAGKNTVVIWAYDSFTSEWGPGPEVEKKFLEETGITVRWVNHGSAGEMLARLLLEGKKADADIVLGIDQNMAEKALGSGLFEVYKSPAASNIIPEAVFDETQRLIPFDYSYFAVIYDSETVKNPPRNLEDLTQAQWQKKLILMDPRTSSPGLGFFAWTRETYGDKWKDYWQRLKPSILTIAEGWSTGYGLFTEGEAPLVLSYTTSPSYHKEYEDTERYKAALFADGHAIQIEAAGILSAAKNKTSARKFIDFMLSPSFQSIIPLTNWMYPVIDIPLPESYSIAPKSSKTLRPAPVTEKELDEWAFNYAN